METKQKPAIYQRELPKKYKDLTRLIDVQSISIHGEIGKSELGTSWRQSIWVKTTPKVDEEILKIVETTYKGMQNAKIIVAEDPKIAYSKVGDGSLVEYDISINFDIYELLLHH